MSDQQFEFLLIHIVIIAWLATEPVMRWAFYFFVASAFVFLYLNH